MGFFASALYSCGGKSVIDNKINGEEKVVEKRIKAVQEVLVFGNTYTIIEVDGIEYISRYNGGITRLYSCKCEK